MGLNQAQREPRSLLHIVKVMGTYGRIATKAPRQTGHSGRGLALGRDVFDSFLGRPIKQSPELKSSHSAFAN